jgi:hypothetical protein
LLKILNIVARALIFSVSFWLSIRILEGHNASNTFGLAVLIGVVVAVFGGMAGPIYGVIPFVGLVYLLIRYYDIGLITALLILVVCSLLQELGGWLIEAIIKA